MEQMEKNLLKTVADISGFMPGSAFSLRKNGAGVERHSTEHVKILAKTDKPGIDIIVDANTVGESIHIPVILTDNGSEFSNPKEIEKRSTIPCNRTKIFYCDPSAPYQKGACEVNHELIRRILPKGSSFDELTQQDITLMMNHINFYKRKKLNNRSPYETFSFYYGEDVLKRLGCSPVAAENIILKPKLLKK